MSGSAIRRSVRWVLVLVASLGFAAVGFAQSMADGETGFAGTLRATDALERARSLAETDDAQALEAALGALTQAAFAGDPLNEARAQALVGELRLAAGDRARAIVAHRAAVRGRTQLRKGRLASALEFAIDVEPVHRRLARLLIDASRERETTDADEAQQLLVEARGVIESLKSAELEDYYEDECLADRGEARIDDVPGSLVLYPILLDDATELIVSDRGRLEAIRVPHGRADMESVIEQMRRRVQDRRTRVYRRAAAELYARLIAPIESRLEAGHVDTLVFVPDGSLRQIPVGALWDAEEKRFLIEKVPVAVTPSLRLTEPRRFAGEELEAMVAALTQSVQGYQPLPGVTSEVAQLEATYASRLLIDDDFVVATTEETMLGRPFEIVHIASHAEFLPRASDSYVLTWESRLGLDQLSTLVGATRFRSERPLELLFLSACETAVGDDRAALGLAGAAVRMGARSVVASLWSVNDEASSELAAAFYRHLAEGEASRAGSLRRAQLELLERPEFRHPYYWSAFILIGSWL